MIELRYGDHRSFHHSVLSAEWERDRLVEKPKAWAILEDGQVLKATPKIEDTDDPHIVRVELANGSYWFLDLRNRPIYVSPSAVEREVLLHLARRNHVRPT